MTTPPQPSPEAPHKPVRDGLAWTIALLPGLGTVAGLFTSTDLTIPYIAVNIALCGLDAIHLKEAGYKPLISWIILIPVYLWKRAALLRRSQATLIVWLTLFAASVAAPFVQQPAANRDIACRLVTEMLQQKDPAAPACKGITILQDPGTGFVKASALLLDGTERIITIEERNDSISVQIISE